MSPADRTGDFQAVTYDRMKIQISHLQACDTRTVRVSLIEVETSWQEHLIERRWTARSGYSRCVHVNKCDHRAERFSCPHSVETKRPRKRIFPAHNVHGRDSASTSTQGYARLDALIPTNKLLMQGSGMKPGTKPRGCGTCGGSGVVTQVARTPLGMLQQQSACPQCQVTLINPVDFSSS